MANKVDTYQQRLTGWKRATFVTLRKSIVEASPDIVEVFKPGQPVYEAHGPVCYLKVNHEHITLGFWRGRALMEIGRAHV